MTKKLIDKSEAYTLYFELGSSRSIAKLHAQLLKSKPKNTPSMDALKKWCTKDKWVERCMISDKAVADGLENTLVPSWVALKAEFIGVLVKQVRAGVAAGVIPENSRDMVAVLKELRALIGDDISKVDVKGAIQGPIPNVEFVFYDSENTRRDAKTKEMTEYQPGDDRPESAIALPNNGRQ